MHTKSIFFFCEYKQIADTLEMETNTAEREFERQIPMRKQFFIYISKIDEKNDRKSSWRGACGLINIDISKPPGTFHIDFSQSGGF